MKQPNASSQHEWMDARVEAYVDGDLSDDDTQRFESILQEETYWRMQVQHAARIQDTLHDVRTPLTPPGLTQQILQQTSRANQPMSWWRRTLQQMVHSWRALGAARRHPVFDYTVGIAFVAMAAFFIIMPLERGANGPARLSSQLEMQTNAPYSAEEIRHAAESAQWTLTSLSELGATTTASVRNQVYRVLGTAPPADSTDPAPASTETAPDEDDPSNAPSPPRPR